MAEMFDTKGIIIANANVVANILIEILLNINNISSFFVLGYKKQGHAEQAQNGRSTPLVEDIQLFILIFNSTGERNPGNTDNMLIAINANRQISESDRELITITVCLIGFTIFCTITHAKQPTS